jgi:hypothetical protein
MNLKKNVPPAVSVALICIILFFAYEYLGAWGRNYKAIDKWIKYITPSFQELKVKNKGLGNVDIHMHTGSGGTIDVNGTIHSKDDELELYRFLISKDPPRPIRMYLNRDY